MIHRASPAFWECYGALPVPVRNLADRAFALLKCDPGGAAGWHICFDVLDRLLAGNPIPRLAGADAMKLEAWKRLTAEYAKQFGVESK